MRTSTPTPRDQNTTGVVSLSQLESILRIAGTSHAEFPELQPASDTSKEALVASFLQPEEHASSSSCDPPPLPGGTTQARILGEFVGRE